MARQLFISVLGTGLYEECKYTYTDENKNFTSSETNFIQKATIEYLCKDNKLLESDDKILILLTDKAKEQNWDKNIKERYNYKTGNNIEYKGLSQVLEEMNLKCEIETKLIPEGKDNNEMWNIFETIFNEINDEDEINLDLTHSFRYLPMLLLVLCNYAKFLKNITIAHVTYGNYEARNLETNTAPIVNLKPLIEIQEWSSAASDYLENGYTEKLEKLSSSNLKPLLKEEKTRTDENKKLNYFVKGLTKYSEERQTCRGVSICDNEQINNLITLSKSIKEIAITPLKPIFNKIKDSFKQNDKEYKNCIDAAKWCYDKHLYQQAITLLQEGIVTKICSDNDIDIIDNKRRNIVNKAFYIKKNNTPKEKWEVSSEKDIEDIDNLLNNDNTIKKLHKDFSDLTELRNDINHGGFRFNAQGVDKIKKKIKELLDLDTVLKNIDTNLKTNTIFINLSNHPSKNWDKQQINAAKQYGEIIDIKFPAVDPNISEKDITTLSDKVVDNILSKYKNSHIYIHIMGEMTLTYKIVQRLKANDIVCLASSTDRIVEDVSDGEKLVKFDFVRFREY